MRHPIAAALVFLALGTTAQAAGYALEGGQIGGVNEPAFDWQARRTPQPDPPKAPIAAWEAWLLYEDGVAWVQIFPAGELEVPIGELGPRILEKLLPEMCRPFRVQVRGVTTEGEPGPFSDPSDLVWLTPDLSGDRWIGAPDHRGIAEAVAGSRTVDDFFCFARLVGSEVTPELEPPAPMTPRQRERLGL